MLTELKLDIQIAQLTQWEFVLLFQITRYHYRAVLGKISGQGLPLSGEA